MKIAIRGHLTRGMDVIQIFKDLDTEEILDHTGSHTDWCYIRDDSLVPGRLIVTPLSPSLSRYYHIYTLEEFEHDR